MPSSPRKIALAMKKVTENPIYKLSAFCGGSGTSTTCRYCHAFIPFPRCQRHGPDNRSFSPPSTVPMTAARLNARTPARGGSLRRPRPRPPRPGACRARPACPGRTGASPSTASPRRSAARGILGRRSWPGRPQAIAIDLTSRMESALDIAGPGRQASPYCSPARTGAGSPGGTSTAPTAAAREPHPRPAPHRNATPVAGGGCRDHRPAQPRT
jgi:hypothetical protein